MHGGHEHAKVIQRDAKGDPKEAQRERQILVRDRHEVEDNDGESMSVKETFTSRQVTELSLYILRETTQRDAAFVHVLEETPIGIDLNTICLLTFHCIYRAAITLSWIATQGDHEQYVERKIACLVFLRRAGSGWKAAGTTLKVEHLFWLTTDYMFSGAYLEVIRPAEAEIWRNCL